MLRSSIWNDYVYVITLTVYFLNLYFDLMVVSRFLVAKVGTLNKAKMAPPF